MIKTFTSFFLLIFWIGLCYAQRSTVYPLITNVYNRSTTLLDGEWHHIIDPYENGYYNYRYEPFDQQTHPWASAFFLNSTPQSPSDLIEYDFDKSPVLTVPGDWNSQKDELLYYEGTVWYKRSFDKVLSEDKRYFLHFGAANYKAEIYLNGAKLGTHIGGFTPFNFEVTDIIKPKDNFLIVKVDNKRLKEGVPTLNTDWWNYGGITRSVQLLELAPTFIRDYSLQLNEDKRLTGEILLDGSNLEGTKVQLQLSELNVQNTFTTNEDGIVTFDLPVSKLERWSPQNPKLYDLHITTSEDSLVDKVGLRTITTSGSKLLLNGQPIFLKGISIHEENPLRGGRAHSREDAAQLLDWAQSLGCNFVRLAHYPHSEHMVRLADERGIMVWEENPVYWTIDWENPDTYLNASNQLTELITRDKNRASVIIWSMANETPNLPARNLFLKKLASLARSIDSTRLISAALEQKNHNDDPLTRTIDDPFADHVDVLSFNEYIGWYDGLPEKCRGINWHITQDKPVFISEFGAGAKQGLHGPKENRWTEEYQEALYQETLQMLERVDNLCGLSPWILVDFRSPRRVLPEIQDGWNRKGLLSDEGKKKKAYHVLRKYYDTK